MLSPLFALLTLASLALAASSNSTAADYPSCDATACDKRSIWSLLASCGLTLLICVWHSVHPALPLPYWKRYQIVMARLCLMLSTFIVPEVTIGAAVEEWLEIQEMTKNVHDRGYPWWTRTHSHFALNGGFVLCDAKGLRETKVNEILRLLDAKEIMNPAVTEASIKDRSSSDGLAKAILAVQLSWFTIQVVVRLVNHLAVTLIELDTLCMALLTIPLIFFWWKKPLCAACPHIFYKYDTSTRSDLEVSMKGNDSEKLLSNEISTISTTRDDDYLLLPTNLDLEDKSLAYSLFLTWATFGALHLAAWNYDFQTVSEKILWRVASLSLIVSAALAFLLWLVLRGTVYGHLSFEVLCPIFFIVVITSRLLLAALMLASLRSLPSSAYQIIPWTTYIPHL